MKKLIATTLAACLLVGAAPAACAEVDLSGMSYQELVELKDQINLAIWESAEWQEVEVPQGVWQVGADIPAGKWTIACNTGMYALLTVGSHLDETGAKIKYPHKAAAMIYNSMSPYYSAGDLVSYTIELSDGDFVSVESATVIFSPYSGKPSLVFK